MADLPEEAGTLPVETPAAETPVETIIDDSTPSADTEPAQNSPEPDKIQKRIDQLTREKYEAKRVAEAAVQEAAYFRQAIEQQQRNPNAPVDANQLQAYVHQEAQRMQQEAEFNRACNKVYDEGIKSIPGFDSSLQNLQLVGLNKDILDVIIDSDAAAKLINYLGSDLDEAARITSLPPVRMAREITKLEAKLAGQPKKTSNAPEPIKPIGGSSKNTKAPGQMSDEEYAKWRRSGR